MTGQMSRAVQEAIRQHHSVPAGSGQCTSMQVQRVRAPLPVVWSIVRRFDRPHSYKCFLRSCSIHDGDGSLPGSVRDVGIATGLPAAASRERLDVLDDEAHLMSFSIIGGDHRLSNYRSTVTVHEDVVEGEEGGGGSVVVESYVVDVPEGSTRQDTCVFADTIIRCNLQNLARIAENNP